MQILNREYDPAVPVTALTPHPANPRRGNVPMISESIAANGFVGACVAQKSTGFILAGNHRYRAAVANGGEAVPVIWVDVDDDAATKILLADNRTNDVAGYDNEGLLALLESVAALETGLGGTGYTDEDMSALIAAVGVPGFDIPEEKNANALERNLANLFGAAGLTGGAAAEAEPTGAASPGDAPASPANGSGEDSTPPPQTSHVRMLQVFVANDKWDGFLAQLATIQKKFGLANNSDAVLHAAELVSEWEASAAG
jgi:hypothetical protein